MKVSSGSRLLLLLFILTTVCLAMAVLYHLLNGFMPLWAMCCDFLGSLFPNSARYWLALLSHTAFLATLIVGSSILWRRLWQTHRFTSQLSVAATNRRATRLEALHNDASLASLSIVTLATPVPLAFCIGLLRPRIYLSTGMMDTLNNKELKAVLLHEAYHCRRYDPLRTLLADVLAATFFFLPTIVEWRDMFLTSTELAADRYAIELTGRPPLAGAMYKVLTHPQSIQLSPAMSSITGFSATSARLEQLLDDTPVQPRFSPRNLVISSFALTLGCILLQLTLS